MKTPRLVGIGCLAALSMTMLSPSFAQQHHMAMPHTNTEHHLLWSGDVDGVVELLIHEREVKVHKVNGKSVDHAQSFFKTPLPREAVTVHVLKQEGRGEVMVFQQPASSNKYTAGVRISDHANGRSHYRINVMW